jgi:6-phosphogluconolactonase
MNWIRRCWRHALAVILASLGSTSIHAADEPPVQHKDTQSMLLYVGTYTGEKSKGIYVVRMDTTTGGLSPPELAAEVEKPSFLTIHPNKQFLYAVSEVSETDGKKSGAVTAFSIDRAGGKLTRLNHQPSGGRGPCFVGIDQTGRCVVVANYGGGTVSSLPVDLQSGELRRAGSVIQHEGSSAHPKRQEGPHAHSIFFDPSNRYALAVDLGIDKVMIYRADLERGTLSANNPPAGKLSPRSGPRHLAFHPNGRCVYVINELGNTITAFTWDAQRGAMEEIQTISTLPEGFSGESYTAEIVVHPAGKFVYGSNRGHDSIAVFKVDEGTGKLTAAGHTSTQGHWPRNFNIDPGGRFLVAANERSHNLVVYQIDQVNGALSATGSSVEIGSPACVKFLE